MKEWIEAFISVVVKLVGRTNYVADDGSKHVWPFGYLSAHQPAIFIPNTCPSSTQPLGTEKPFRIANHWWLQGLKRSFDGGSIKHP